MNTIGRTTEKGNGKRLRDICAHNDLIPMAKWRRQPSQTKHEPEDISTLVQPCGAVKRQIDYIMVSQKYRNCVRKAHVIHEWGGNQEQRHRAAVKWRSVSAAKNNISRHQSKTQEMNRSTISNT